MTSWPYRAYLLVGAAAAVLWPISGPVAQSVVYGLLGTGASVTILVALRRRRPRPAAVWWCFWAAVAVGQLGDTVLGLRTWAFPDIGGLLVLEGMLYLLSYPALAAGLVLILRNRSGGRDLGVTIDAAIVACALALPLWLVAVAPILDEPDQTVVVLPIRLAMPLGDVVLMTLLARLLVGGKAGNGSLHLLAGAMCCWLAGDAANAVLAEGGATGAYWGGALYCVSYTLFAAAALHPSMPALAAPADVPAPRLTTRRLVVLAALALLAPALLLGQALTGREVDAVPVGISCIALFLLVVARMAGLTRQVEQQAGELSDLAARDALTGVGNRRSWDTRLTGAVAAARASGEPLTIALLDLDHFKRYNDTHGHQAGDRLLKGAAAAWLAVLRRDDVLYRYGGEEFGLILPGASAADVVALADRLRSVMPDDQSFSAGVAVLRDAEGPDELVARADATLYEVKAQGRGRAMAAA